MKCIFKKHNQYKFSFVRKTYYPRIYLLRARTQTLQDFLATDILYIGFCWAAYESSWLCYMQFYNLTQ